MKGKKTFHTTKVVTLPSHCCTSLCLSSRCSCHVTTAVLPSHEWSWTFFFVKMILKLNSTGIFLHCGSPSTNFLFINVFPFAREYQLEKEQPFSIRYLTIVLHKNRLLHIKQKFGHYCRTVTQLRLQASVTMSSQTESLGCLSMPLKCFLYIWTSRTYVNGSVFWFICLMHVWQRKIPAGCKVQCFAVSITIDTLTDITWLMYCPPQ